MKNVIAVVNQKGGVGKTTISMNLAASLSYLSKEILLIDFDPQKNATSGLGIQSDNKNIYKLISNEIALNQAITRTDFDFLDLIPSTVDLIGLELELINYPDKEFQLKKITDEIKTHYDYIFIDCPPSLGILTLNSLTAADFILIPIQSEYYSMEGLSMLIKTIQLVKNSFNPNLEILGIVITMIDNRLNLSKEVESEVRKFFTDKVFNTTIPRNVKIAEAPSFGKPVIHYEPESKGSFAFLTLAKEFIEKISNNT